MTIAPGTLLGHYEIRSWLGTGGMVQVYLAQDTHLEGTVALKVLPADVAANQQRMHRFIQEAKVVSALNHPNILTIYEISQADSLHFIATEFIDGMTLRQHMSNQKMKLREALETTIQVAAALSAAHAAGIVHRDIKPENIMVRTDGYIKVLDFGIAKLAERQAQTIDPEAQTKALVKTEPGMMIGTAHYMSPEQARGLPVDARSDIRSLGVVLYEMVTGRLPFEGVTTTDVIISIAERESVPLARYRPEVPTELERIVKKALCKDREERYQVVKDLLLDVKSLKQALEFEAELERSFPPELRGSAAMTDRRQSPVETAHKTGARATDVGAAHPTSSAEYLVGEIKHHKRGVALALGTLAVVLTVWWYLPPRSGEETKRTPAGLPRSATFTQLTDQPGPELFPSLSADGKSLVYASSASGNWDIYLQRVHGKNPTNLTRDSPAEDTQPAFSPDGERIVFRSERNGGGLFLMGATGENVKRLTDFGYHPAWSPDGKEILCSTEGVVNPGSRSTYPSQLQAVNVATGE